MLAHARGVAVNAIIYIEDERETWRTRQIMVYIYIYIINLLIYINFNINTLNNIFKTKTDTNQ